MRTPYRIIIFLDIIDAAKDKVDIGPNKRCVGYLNYIYFAFWVYQKQTGLRKYISTSFGRGSERYNPNFLI